MSWYCSCSAPSAVSVVKFTCRMSFPSIPRCKGTCCTPRARACLALQTSLYDELIDLKLMKAKNFDRRYKKGKQSSPCQNRSWFISLSGYGHECSWITLICLKKSMFHLYKFQFHQNKASYQKYCTSFLKNKFSLSLKLVKLRFCVNLLQQLLFLFKWWQLNVEANYIVQFPLWCLFWINPSLYNGLTLVKMGEIWCTYLEEILLFSHIIRTGRCPSKERSIRVGPLQPGDSCSPTRHPRAPSLNHTISCS